METKRLLLFLIGCIGCRLVLTLLAKQYPDYLQYIGIITLAISIGFFYFYFTGSRKTGFETFGEKIWWNKLRPLHGSLYLLFSILAFRKHPLAWVVLLIDTLIGIGAFIHFHELYKI
jgi:hypothetical protein